MALADEGRTHQEGRDIELKTWKLRLASVIGLILGLAGILVGGFVFGLCGGTADAAFPSGPSCSPFFPLETIGILDAFVALVVASLIVLAYSFLRRPLTTKGGTAS